MGAPPRLAAILLIAGFVVVMVGVVLFFGRNGLEDGAPPSTTYHAIERGAMVWAAALSAGGVALLAAHLRGWVAIAAALAYIGAVIPLAIAEHASVFSDTERYPLIVAYVVAGYLAQAVLGGALVRAALVPGAGWAAVAVGLGLLVLLLVATPGDVYYPALHHVMPLAIGIALLAAR